MSDFRGLYAIVPTAFRQDEQLDLPKQKTHIEYLIDQGVHGIVALGSTGEAFSLSESERCAVAECCIGAVDGKVPVIVGTSANCTLETVRHSQFAERAGADAIMVIPPYYSMPDETEIYDHFAAVCAAVRIPVMAYNNPRQAGVELTPALLGRLADIPNLEYFKDSSGNYRNIKELVATVGDRMKIFQAPGILALESLMMGAVGWVAVSANLAPKRTVALYNAAATGNWADAIRIARELLPMELRISKGGRYVQAVKSGLELQGRSMGPTRRPLKLFAGTDREEMQMALAAIGALV